jgi:L-amino acid N-acyltransferase YncA
VNYLVDTNIVIPLEPTSPVDLAVNTPLALEFHKLATKYGHNLFVHPHIEFDLGRDKDQSRAALRRTLLRRYQMLVPPPQITTHLQGVIGCAEPGSRDWVDDSLLAALERNAVDYLVTEDAEIHNKAARLGLASRTLRLAEAVDSLRALFDEHPAPPPAVEELPAYLLDERDPIFESLRADYADFDRWLKKCKREHRTSYVIWSPARDRLAGLCIVKREEEDKFGLTGKVLKICTLKVCDEYSGNRYGELLLKPVFDYLGQKDFDQVFVTVFPRHEILIDMLHSFGFEELPQQSRSGESVLAKRLKFTAEEKQRLIPLEFNRQFGPWVTKFEGNSTFIVPIKPMYHALLFPEIESQTELFPGHAACGNSIKKAYLCHSPIATMCGGDNLLFYRSEDLKAATAVGIVEDCLRSPDAKIITYYVGTRTVYTSRQIAEMCTASAVLAVLFRRVLFLEPPISCDELARGRCLQGPPQSIQAIPTAGIQWLVQRIEM